MPFLWTAAGKDLRRQLRDPMSLAFSAGLPALVGLLVMLAFGGREARTPRVALLVADEDSSFVSRLVVGAFRQGELFDLTTTGRAAGRARLDRGGASALLVIPRGFGAALLDDAPTRLELVKNPAQEILPEIAEQYLSVLADGGFYAQRLFGDQLRNIRAAARRQEAPTDSLVAAVAVGVRQRLAGAGRWLDPPRLRVTSLDVTPRRPTTPGGAPATETLGFLFFPGLLLMSILFAAQSVSADLWLEKAQGTLRRVVGTPGGVNAFLGGKLLAGAAQMTALAGVAAIVGGLLFHLPVGRLVPAALFAGLAGTVFLALLLLLQSAASARRTANITTSLLVMPLQMLGGSFFPLEVMPPFLARLGRLTPNGFALEQVKGLLRGVMPAAFWPGTLALVIAGVVAFLLVTRRLRRGFAVS